MLAMIIDDSKAMRTIIGRILKGLGLETTEASHGVEGLQRLAGGLRPDLMLVDWNMPEMNGLDFVKAVRSQPELNHIPLIMVTTETEASRMIQAMESGANEYVMKPFTAEILQQKLALTGLATV